MVGWGDTGMDVGGVVSVVEAAGVADVVEVVEVVEEEESGLFVVVVAAFVSTGFSSPLMYPPTTVHERSAVLKSFVALTSRGSSMCSEEGKVVFRMVSYFFNVAKFFSCLFSMASFCFNAALSLCSLR